jgi:type IV secretion system protein TrbL
MQPNRTDAANRGGTTDTDPKRDAGGLLTETHWLVTKVMRYRAVNLFLLALFVTLAVPLAAHAQGVDVHGVVDTLLGKYKTAGEAWIITIQNAATKLFWLLATISLAWTCISMGIKQADLVEIVAELCRFIMFTGFFFWLLLNGASFANGIINSLRQVGGEAAGTGQAIYPGDLITLGMQVFQQEMLQINILLPAATGIPAAIALIILIICALIAVNMILLLCAAWIVLYAGLIFLGFGGCRWTSDMAINYYRSVLGVGVSLMTMQLIIGIGIQFLQQLVASTGSNPDAGQVAIIMCATIILAVISHRLPHMVAGMILGGGNNGAIGGVGVMTLLAGGMMGANWAGRLGANPTAPVATDGVGEGAKMLQDRISAVEAAMGAQSSSQASSLAGSSGSSQTSWSNSGAAASAQARQSAGGGRGSSRSAGVVGAGKMNVGSGSDGKPQLGQRLVSDTGVKPVEPPEPPLERPMSPDEQRGFGPDGNSDPNDGGNVT